MSITLKQILDLVEKLDDSPGDDTPRERFRRFLKENVKEVGQVRDYVEECIRTCLLYTSDAADELDGVDLGGRRCSSDGRQHSHRR